MMKAKGFTLIELLVVITIIGILATGATALYTGSQQKARDNVRITDVMVYKTGIAQLYDDEGQTYTDAADEVGLNVGDKLKANGYIETIILDAKDANQGPSNTALKTEILEYRYQNGDFNGVADQAYEISTAFEAKGNIGSAGKAQQDGGSDADRFEVGINTGTINTSADEVTVADQKIATGTV